MISFAFRIMYLNAASDVRTTEPGSNDPAGFELLYTRMRSALEKYAFYYVRDEAAANAIVNDLFIQLWFKGQQPENINGYLYKAIKNGCLNYLGQKKRNPLSYLEQDELVLISDLNTADQELIFESDQLKFLHKIIALLPPKRQLVFRMYRLDGFSYAEIADLLQVSIRTVEDHLVKSMQFIHERSKHFIHTDLTEA